MITTPNINQAKEQIKKTAEKPIIVQSPSDEFSRKILEYGKFQILLLPKSQNKDRLRHLDSGLNHVLAKIAAKNKVAIGIDLNSITKLNKKEKAIQLAKIRQNIKICRKARCKIEFINIKDKKDAQALLISLGASTQQIN
ncbi:hypothetical protein J4402_01740 [Candidatus Pacearchaeota archaeon]|nr:hypothetical protein [Candidatus Pacearchaeota archaeon]